MANCTSPVGNGSHLILWIAGYFASCRLDERRSGGGVELADRGLFEDFSFISWAAAEVLVMKGLDPFDSEMR